MHVYGPPSGHTGGFGEPTCQQCHTEYDLNEPGGSLEVEGLPGAWEAGVSYALVVVLRSEEMGRAGFQLSARSSDGRPVGVLSAPGPRVSIVDTTGVPYAQHTESGTDPTTPEEARWAVAWRAPAEGAGPVHFNIAANSANGDNSPFGDLIYSTEVVLPGPATSSTPRSSPRPEPPRTR